MGLPWSGSTLEYCGKNAPVEKGLLWRNEEIYPSLWAVTEALPLKDGRLKYQSSVIFELLWSCVDLHRMVAQIHHTGLKRVFCRSNAA